MKTSANVIDLFCGCGGFSLGARLAGYKPIVSVDIDKTLSSTYSLNFPESNIVNADLSVVELDFWANCLREQEVEGVIGGPPCQGYSRIGKSDKADPRRSLLGHFARNVKAIDPKFFIMENVEGLLDEKNKNELENLISSLSEKFTIVGPMVLNAKDFGVPTNRKRVIVVGYKKQYYDAITCDDFLPQVPLFVSVKDAIYDIPDPVAGYKTKVAHDFSWGKYSLDKRSISSYAKAMRQGPPDGLGWDIALNMLEKGLISGLLNTQHSPEVAARYKATLPGKIDKISRSKKLSWVGLAPTLRAGTGSDKGSYQAVRPLHPDKGRVITVREAARLQGFPDWFVFHHTKWHSFRMIGNSVSPILAKSILDVVGKKKKLQNNMAA